MREPPAANAEPAPETVRPGGTRAGTLPGVGGEGPVAQDAPEIRAEADAEANTEASLPPVPVEAQSAPSSVAGAAAAPSGGAAAPSGESQIGERPTQLVAGNSAASRATGSLRQVPLVRAEGAGGDDDAPPANTYVGYIVDGRYRIDGVLGRGGMGVVYRAKHEIIEKLAAIKILLPTEDADVVERFVNEARAATAIGNAHIVDTVDFGELPDGSTYFVMEYLEGQTLAQRIKKDHFVPSAKALAIAKQIAEGMGAAHRAGIVHRDLKPENIFLTRRDDEEDFVKLLDFGIAKVQNAQNRITRAGTIFGTPHYMSPEQAAGTEVDPRTDVYSLGIILYEMLAGRVPFDAENPMGLLTQHMYTEPVPLVRLGTRPQPVDTRLDAVVLKCLAKRTQDRYASMADLAADIERLENGEPPAALADLLARAERDKDRKLLALARRELRGKSATRWIPWIVTGVSLSIVVAAAGLVSALRGGPDVAPLASSRAKPSPSARATSAKHSVALVFSPIDAEVFRNGKNLGGMPVAIALSPGETADVEIRREGFYPEHVRLDESRSVVVVRLTPIPGVQPRVPVPSGEPLEALHPPPSAPNAKVGLVAPSPSKPAATNHRDAGAPSISHHDAGTFTAPSPAQPQVAPTASPANSAPPSPPAEPPPIEVPPVVSPPPSHPEEPPAPVPPPPEAPPAGSAP